MFQRTPSYAWPAGNRPLDPELQRKVKTQYRELRVEQRNNYGGVVGTSGAVAVPMPRDVAILEATPEERLAAVDELGWAACRAWNDVLSDLEANELGAELFREMVRRVVDDPETADGLSPRDLAIGCKRPILHTDYYETFNLEHVSLVDLRRGGIIEVTPTGIRTEQGDFELDVIVYATGFDAMTGALDRIDIRGRDGVRAARRVVRRRADVARHPDRGVPEPVHHHRAGQSVGARQHGRVRRAAHRVDR